jgi:hypothetical protein
VRLTVPFPLESLFNEEALRRVDMPDQELE